MNRRGWGRAPKRERYAAEKDAFLVQCLAVEYDWAPRVYKETSGYIHLSEKHLFAPYEPARNAERTIKMSVSAQDKPLPDHVYTEALDAFAASAAIFYRYL